MKSKNILRWKTMAKLGGLFLLLSGWSVLPLPAAAKISDWSLASPNQRCAIRLRLEPDGRLSYETIYHGKTVITKSPLGLRFDDQSFEQALVFDHASRMEKRVESYELFADAQPSVRHVVNHQSFTFHNPGGSPFEIDFAASDEGVAFRYHFPNSSPEAQVVKAELTGFMVPTNSKGWLQPYHAAGQYTPAYEDFYFNVLPGERPPDSRAKAVGWAFPALFHVAEADAWALITESGNDETYCACHLDPDSSGGLYRIAFPLADEATSGHTNQFGPEPRHTLPWTMPWRVIVMAQAPGEIATERLVTDLAPPSRISNTDWIHPGRASWAWWSYPDKPTSLERFNEFTDLAARMGWEYTLFDAGWKGPGLQPIADFARSKKIAPLLWLQAGDFYDAKKRGEKLDQLKAAGVRGVKVDFWCSDRQETIEAQQGLMRDAAERQMLVNLHGCTTPRGWERTWPNFITCEAVLGSESYFYESRYPEKAAELDTVLPFTRNAVGPMDLTPIACSPKKYARTTTAAHQLAASLIFTSGIIHYADSPEFFASLPPLAVQVLRDAPARWDETICLGGEPGRSVIFARRAGKSWFIAGINGTGETMAVMLDLSRFKNYPHRFAILEGKGAIMQVTVAPMADGTEWQHKIPPRGGFILRLNQ